MVTETRHAQSGEALERAVEKPTEYLRCSDETTRQRLFGDFGKSLPMGNWFARGRLTLSDGTVVMTIAEVRPQLVPADILALSNTDPERCIFPASAA